jgi:predicted dehydrogenase
MIRAVVIGLGWWGQTILKNLLDNTVISRCSPSIHWIRRVLRRRRSASRPHRGSRTPWRNPVLGSKGWMEIRDRSHPENSTGWDVTSVHWDQTPVTAFYAPRPAVRDNLEAFGRATLGQAPYPVAPDEMLANVRSFEAIQRSVKSGTIEII